MSDELGDEPISRKDLNQNTKHRYRVTNHEDTKNTKRTRKDQLQIVLRALRVFVVCTNLCCSDLEYFFEDHSDDEIAALITGEAVQRLQVPDLEFGDGHVELQPSAESESRLLPR